MVGTDTNGARRRSFIKAVGAGTAVTLAGCLGGGDGGGGDGGGGGGGGNGEMQIPVGITADLTGPTSFISEAATGISYYLEYINERRNGLEGEGQYYFQPVVRDGAEDVQAERQAFEFYRDQLNAVFVHIWGTPGNVALAPDVEEAGIPELGQSKSEAWATENEYMHLFGTSYEDFVRIYMDWAVENKGEDIAILYSAFGAPVVERVVEERGYQDEAGANIVTTIQHGFAPSDLTAQMENLQAQEPDFIIHINVLEGAAPAISALNDLGMDPTSYGTFNWSSIPSLFDVVDNTEGIYGITPNPTTYPPDVPARDEIQWYLNNIGGVSSAEQQSFLYNGWAKGKLIEELTLIAKNELEPQGELPSDTQELRGAIQEAWGQIENLDTESGVPTIDYVNNPLKGFRGGTIYQAEGGSWASRYTGTPQSPFEP